MQKQDEFDKQVQKEEQELLETLMKKEAALEKAEKEKKQHEKEINNIQRSRTWKYTSPLRRLNKRFSSSKRQTSKEQAKQIDELQAQLYQAQLALKKTKDDLSEVKQDRLKTLKGVRKTKDEGLIIPYLDRVIEDKKMMEAEYLDVFRYIASLYKNDRAEYRNLVYAKLMSEMDPKDIPDMIVRAAEGENSLSLKQAASFRASLTMRMRQKQLLASTLPEWALDVKDDAYSFVDKLGVRRPWTTGAFRHFDIPKQEGIVIKPVHGAGSRGVYLVYDVHDIIDVKRAKTLHDWEALKANMKEDLATNWVHDDEWFVEELIYEDKEEKIPATDIKFYSFYGKIALILEITRFPEIKYCWWLPNGERIRTGKYDEDLFKGQGARQPDIDLASAISAEIPAPFIRIDFLKGDNGLVFGEFTPKPGNYDEFDEHTDQGMGDYFIEAQGRLTEDLLHGKQFPHYKALATNLNK